MAGKSTLNRLELSAKKEDRYKKILCDTEAVDRLLVDVFLESYRKAPDQIVLDLDATDFAIHGQQEGRFFHGFYDHYCYLPLYIFCDNHLLGARLRQSNIDGSAGSLEEVKRIVGQIRKSWPGVRIILRADSGFCRDGLMDWCEDNDVDFVFGLARNSRLEAILAPQMREAAAQFTQTGQRARIFTEFQYETLDSWSRPRRVIGKAEHTEGKANPRFVVTSLSAESWPPQQLYEDLYCARGDMENRIKEQLSLFADRVSAETMQANQLRIYFSAIAYLLVDGLRRLALTGTEMARAQVGTIRLRSAKDRRTSPHHRPQDLDLDGCQLSLPATLSSRLGCSALLKTFSITRYSIDSTADVSSKTGIFLPQSRSLRKIRPSIIRYGARNENEGLFGDPFAEKMSRSSPLVRNAG